MSLYHQAAAVLSTTRELHGSLKSRIFNAKDTKVAPGQVYALVSEAAKWSAILKEVVENSSLLVFERKLSPELALLLVHDLLLAKKGVAAPTNHPLRTAVERHRARLQAEFTRARIRRGFPSMEAVRKHVENVSYGTVIPDDRDGSKEGIDRPKWPHPRWIRINTLKTTLEQQLATTFSGYEKADSLQEVFRAQPAERILHIDFHIPDLIALPPGTDISKCAAYDQGQLMPQDKASCFPAYLLNPSAGDGAVLDACAAPGNKTTHLAALGEHLKSRIEIKACEKDPKRARILQEMTRKAGASKLVSILGGQDFTSLDPTEGRFQEIGALLLDPSCSGSGILGRDELKFILPKRNTALEPRTTAKKRKRAQDLEPPVATVGVPENEIRIQGFHGKELTDRLASLSSFQTKLLVHAFRFPQAKKVTYSTCSIYAEENENVVLAALGSPIAKERDWRILRREEQVPGLASWKTRGILEFCGHGSNAHVIADACIRCSKDSEDGTQGFFVAAFVRDVRGTDTEVENGGRNSASSSQDEDEWEGFQDD